jgi:hypothetical protein
MWYDISLLDLYLELIFYKYMIEYTGELVKPPIDHGRKRSIYNSLVVRFCWECCRCPYSLHACICHLAQLQTIILKLMWLFLKELIAYCVEVLYKAVEILFLVNVRRAGTCMFRSNFINHKGWKYCSSD